MSHFQFRLYDDFFTLLDPSDNEFGDPGFRGMCVPQRIRNLILQAKDDIIVPAHFKQRHFGNRVLQQPVPEHRVTRWRLVSNGDLTVTYQSTPEPTSTHPNPEQVVQWRGDFELSYYEEVRPGFTNLVVTEFSAEMGVNATAYNSGVWMQWALIPGGVALLPGAKVNVSTVPLSWSSALPDHPNAPATPLRYTDAMVGGDWAF